MAKKTIFEVLYEKFKKKPTTREEIEQLKLEAEKLHIKADMAEDKARINKSKSANMDKLMDIFGPASDKYNSEEKIKKAFGI